MQAEQEVDTMMKCGMKCAVLMLPGNEAGGRSLDSDAGNRGLISSYAFREGGTKAPTLHHHWGCAETEVDD